MRCIRVSLLELLNPSRFPAPQPPQVSPHHLGFLWNLRHSCLPPASRTPCSLCFVLHRTAGGTPTPGAESDEPAGLHPPVAPSLGEAPVLMKSPRALPAPHPTAPRPPSALPVHPHPSFCRRVLAAWNVPPAACGQKAPPGMAFLVPSPPHQPATATALACLPISFLPVALARGSHTSCVLSRPVVSHSW